MASTYLTRTFGSAGNRKTWTWSVWVKRSALGGTQNLLNAGHPTNPWWTLTFNSDAINFAQTSGTSASWATSALFRDTSAWYHIVLAVDTTSSTSTMNGSSTDRIRLYVNGEQYTVTGGTIPSQNADLQVNQAIEHRIGTAPYGNAFDGLMSHIHFIDGTAYGPDNFGSTDATTGEWKIKTSPSVTYGTNGFFILKDGNSVTDQSGNSNNWTVGGGTLTKTEDNPSNNFATLNAVSFHEANFSLSNGANTMATGNNTQWNNAICSTLVATGGKFYWEAKWTDGDSYSVIGIIKAEDIHRCATSLSGTGTDIYMHANAIQTDNGGGSPQKYSFVSSDGNISISAPPGCIMQFALDCENRKFWFGVNGTFYNSGNPATGANPTWDTTDIPADGEFVPYAQGYKISGATAFQFNFGNGYFGTTAVSSAGTNASNNGIFEYDVPSGFTALSTKGLNE